MAIKTKKARGEKSRMETAAKPAKFPQAGPFQNLWVGYLEWRINFIAGQKTKKTQQERSAQQTK